MLMFLGAGRGGDAVVIFGLEEMKNRCMLQDSTKRQYLATKLHGVASHKIVIVITDVFVAHVRSKATSQMLILLFIISGRAG